MTVYADTPLTTLDAVLGRMNAEGYANPDDDALIVQLIATATAMAHGYCARSFVPYRQARVYDATGEHIDPINELLLDADLLAVTSVTNGDGTTVTGDQYVLRPANAWPKRAIKLKASSNLTWTYDGDWEQAISIEGVWGYHQSYGSAWVNTGVQDVGGIDASVQTITVSDADGKDARYHTRFQVGMLLRIDDEFMQLVAVDAANNTLTVLRGQLGTTAAVHDVNTAIHSYAPMRDIEQAIISLTVWLHRNGATAGDAVHFMENGSTIIDNRVPSNIKQTLQRHARHEWGF